MSTALRLRHTNRTGLPHLSAVGAWREGDATPFGHAERVHQHRRPRPGGPPATAGVAPQPQAAAGRRSRRHDLLPVVPGQAVCTDCECVVELHAYVEVGRRLPACLPGLA